SPNRSLQPHPAVQGGFQRDCAYRFANLEHLLQACRRLRGAGYIGESAAYRDENGAYFLLFTVLSHSPFSMPDQWNFIVEYGTVENAALLRLYMLEHGRVICPREAVERLAALA
ncbi:MAG: adaptor protein MecA, partial [Clostridia bacterium]|nr:adaptor protein MecA [Clostridia bacterium]